MPNCSSKPSCVVDFAFSPPAVVDRRIDPRILIPQGLGDKPSARSSEARSSRCSENVSRQGSAAAIRAAACLPSQGCAPQAPHALGGQRGRPPIQSRMPVLAPVRPLWSGRYSAAVHLELLVSQPLRCRQARCHWPQQTSDTPPRLAMHRKHFTRTDRQDRVMGCSCARPVQAPIHPASFRGQTFRTDAPRGLIRPVCNVLTRANI